jgi:hypothetical protein
MVDGIKMVYEIGIILTCHSIQLRRLTMDFTITNVAASFVLRITTGIMNGKHLLIFCDLQTKQSHVGFRGRAIGCGQRLKRAMALSIDFVAT